MEKTYPDPFSQKSHFRFYLVLALLIFVGQLFYMFLLIQWKETEYLKKIEKITLEHRQMLQIQEARFQFEIEIFKHNATQCGYQLQFLESKIGPKAMEEIQQEQEQQKLFFRKVNRSEKTDDDNPSGRKKTKRGK